MAGQRIDALDAHRLPLDEQFARPVRHQHCLVLRALDRHEAHAGRAMAFQIAAASAASFLPRLT
jgi:hypothetical protein